MENPYWIVDNGIIFKPEFNESLDSYVDIISNYRILIFSNYDDSYRALKNNEFYSYYKSKKLFAHSLFNNQLGNSFLNLIYLRELSLGYDFNQPLDNCLSNLINLQKLTLSNEFNQSLDNALSNLHNLQKLTLGYDFNQHINIPEWITNLVVNCNSHSIIDYLPSNIVELEFGSYFNLELNDLPSSIKKIKIRNEDYDKKLNNLPKSIETLEISFEYKVTIDFKYKNLNIVRF